MTTQPKHTQAPWKIRREYSNAKNCLDIWTDEGAGSIMIATIHPASWDVTCTYEEEANARLIAAAPELLAALKALMQEAGIDENDLASLAEPQAFRQAWDAINKAEGRA